MVTNRSVVIELLSDSDLSLCVTTPTRAPVKLTSVSPQAQRFLKNLDNYLPIGSLILAEKHDQAQPEWHEIFEANTFGLSESLTTDFTKLLATGRIRVFASQPPCVLRVYVLPEDVGHRYVQHDNKLDSHLFSVIKELDVSAGAWNGSPQERKPFDMYASGEEGSLYYLFNSIPSPNPSMANIKNPFHRAAMSKILRPRSIPGLKTHLYPYQRRSAGLMLQRECEKDIQLDPRLEERTGPDGSKYFYGPWDCQFLRSPRYYESCKGGLLSETMGLGKTLICIALILATKGHLPETPAQYDRISTRPAVGSLVEMAISSVNRNSAPWRTFFEQHEQRTGEHMANCVALMQHNVPSYEVPVEPIRWNRNTTVPLPKRLTLAATTIVVVPRNLLSQWRSELTKHAEQDSLKVLFMEDNKTTLPDASELAMYDIIMFSRSRFEYEDRDGSDNTGRRLSRYPPSCNCPYIGASRVRDCVCIRVDEIYNSPLKLLHFLRIIIDEGHSISSENTRIALVANKLVEASHRWVVSGTPAKDLLGVEMDLVAPRSGSNSDSDDLSGAGRLSLDPAAVLCQRKQYIAREETKGAVRNIGSILSNFLKVRPWAPGEGERGADWVNHMFRHEMTRLHMKTYTGFSKCLRRTLEAIVIKTQPADVEVRLPPLHHRVVRLEPSYYDKLTVNAFVFVLTANAVTSERTDVDYIFHKNSGKEKTQLLNNLRTSAFYWTGFSVEDIQAAQEQSLRYLQKENKLSSPDDQHLLSRCIDQSRMLTESSGWQALGISHEVGLFLEDWPTESLEFWSFDKTSSPMLCGASQLLQAQDHVNKQCGMDDPSEGLSGAGLRSLAVLRAVPKSKTAAPTLIKTGIPSSSLAIDQGSQRRLSTLRSPTKKETKNEIESSSKDINKDLKGLSKELSADSALRKTKIVGTTSSKLSYLMSQILGLYQEEKILVFYDSDNVAYYIAQALEIVHINHLIYAKTLSAPLKSDYVVRFNQEPKIRVLLMDINQAAYGLNFPCASRVFFVNPVNRPNDEAQALKRAHRIGQTREVYAETLILKDTIEEAMFERARKMTRTEHREAKELDDDQGIRQIIQNAKPLEVDKGEGRGCGPVARIDVPQQLFGRVGWATWKEAAKENTLVVEGIEAEVSSNGKRKRKRDAQASASVTSNKKRKRKAKESSGVIEEDGHVENRESYSSIFGGV